MVIPSLSHATQHGEERFYESPIFSIWEAAGIFCLIGAASFLLLRSFATLNPVPRKDPYLAESLHYHAG
jgi:hypothetical protein